MHIKNSMLQIKNKWQRPYLQIVKKDWKKAIANWIFFEKRKNYSYEKKI